MEILELMRSTGLIPGPTVLPGWRDPDTGTWHAEEHCPVADLAASSARVAGTARFDDVLALPDGLRCACTRRLVNYYTQVTSAEISALVYLAGRDLDEIATATAVEGPARTVARLRQAAAHRHRGLVDRLRAHIDRQVAEILQTAESHRAGAGFAADAGYRLVRELPFHQPLGENVPPARYGLHPGTPAQRLADLSPEHQGRITTALDRLHDVLPVDVWRDVQTHTKTSPHDPGPYRDRMAAVMGAVADDTMWFHWHRDTTDAPNLLAWADGFDPAFEQLVRLPTVVWWTAQGPDLTPMVADGSVPPAEVQEAWRLADRRIWAVEDTLSALRATRL